jgi:hypothetical protein
VPAHDATTTTATATRSKFALHGPAVEIACAVPEVARQVRRLFDPFAVAGWPAGFVPTVGVVRPYEQAEVLRHLSPDARPVPGAPDLMELYQDGDRYWLVDERWGLAEVNMLRGQFRSWILPAPRVDAVRCTELAVVWPLAQLLRAKGVHLLPAVSAVRDGWAVMILCPFTLEPELVALVRAGYKVIGQRWTAVREEDGRLALLHLPGAVERSSVPRLRSPSGGGGGGGVGPDGAGGREGEWIDLSHEYLGSWQNHAFCDAVLVAEGGRRAAPAVRDLDPADALGVLRRAWPVAELHSQRRHAQLPARIAHAARVCELRLSCRPTDLLSLLDDLRRSRPGSLADAAAAADRPGTGPALAAWGAAAA